VARAAVEPEVAADAPPAPGPRPAWRGYVSSALIAVAVALAARAFVVDSFRIPSASMVPTLLVGDHIFVSKLAYGVRVPFTNVRLLELGAPSRGDVVVFENPHDPSRAWVKRIVGIPGDVIEVRDQIVHVNGVPQPRAPAGEITYEERDEATGALTRDTCHLFREALARGEIPPVEAAAAGGPCPGAGEAAARCEESRWQAAALSGVSEHEVVQCRRARFAAREGPFEVVRPGHVFVMGDNRDRSADSRSGGGWQVPVQNLRGRAAVVFFSWGDRPDGGRGVRLDRLFKPVE
jgi:signal peptidase I